MNHYSILIPIHNEVDYVPTLLTSLRKYYEQGHQVIIIDDGSNDDTTSILKGCDFIKLIIINENKGKGNAIKQGLKYSINERIIIFDGDMEIHPSEISKLMILESHNNVRLVIGYRFESLAPLKSEFDWGNFMFTSFYNIIFNSNHKDILCSSKAFYKVDLIGYDIISNKFYIDSELSIILSIVNKKQKILQVKLDYKRRTAEEGKKLKVADGWSILSRIMKMIKHL